MNTITSYLIEAELALAAYANLGTDISDDPYMNALKDAGMAQKQAEEFAKHWRVIEQYDGKVEETYVDEFGQEHFFLNPTGLSVTLFEEVGTGKQVVAVRGTQPTDILDLTTDLIDLIVLGTDEHQAQYKALTGQVRKWMDDGVLQSGFSVTGHSLGGFLATNLALDYAGDVSHTYIYNAPGVEGVVRGNVIGAVWNAYSPDSPFAIPAVLSISNVVAKTDVSSDIGLYIKPPITIQIESNIDPFHNHGIVTLTDALAIYDLFARVDPTVSVATVTSILKAASNQSANTLDSALAELGWVYGKSYSSIENADEIAARNDLYKNVYDLQEAIGTNQGKVVSLVGQSRAQIASLAKTDIAYRHALEWLTPFVVTGNDSLFSDHNADGHLDANRFSDLYLQDRAAMLTWKMQFDSGAKDYDDLLPGDKSYDDDWDTLSIADDWKFTDMTRGITLTIDGNGGDTHKIVFGSAEADTVSGGSKSDHLYGMAGNDTISGGAGNDHLEGGTGNDTLQGGTGYDTYVWHPGDGNDQIIDEREADGKVHGIIKIDNDLGQNVVVGGAYVQQGTSEVWQQMLPNGSAGLTISHNDTQWTLTLADGSALTLANFQAGDFGIGLVAEGTDPGSSLAISGDMEPAKFYDEDSNWHYEYDDLGNIITGRYAMDAGGNVIYVSNPESGREDTLYDSVGNDRLEGFGGNDILSAHRGGNDVLLGGEGSDAILGGAGNDRLYADGEQDLLTAYLEGESGVGTGTRGDLLSGNEGDDQLYGGAGNDALAGGSGNDILSGGAGDDVIEGDGNYYGVGSIVWSVTPTEQAVYYEKFSRNLPTEQGNDFIYGGAGNDWIFAQGGDDFVDAGADNDQVWGGAGADVLFGQAGNDQLHGDYSLETTVGEDGDDYLDGGAGNDTLWGGGGGDTLIGGAGDDLLAGDSNETPVSELGDDYLDGGDGNDTLWGGGGADTLIGGTGDDLLDGDSSNTPIMAQGNDYLDGGDGNDKMAGRGGADILLGGAGDDLLQGDSDDTPIEAQGDDYLDGGDGNDFLVGYGGNDTLIGGAGDDELYGDEGNDIYLYNLDGGKDTIYDRDYNTGNQDTIRFGEGIAAGDITFSRSAYDLILGINGTNDQVRIQDWGYEDAYRIEQVEFADGTVWAAAYVQSQITAIPIVGTNGNDSLQAWSGGNETLQGMAGDDYLYGDDGNDILDGGAGNDRLEGWWGNDVYLYNLGGGQDTIYDCDYNVGNLDTLRFGEGIEASDITFGYSGSSLVLGINGFTDDMVVIEKWGSEDAYRIERVSFADGTVWDATYVQSRIPGEFRTGTNGNDSLWASSIGNATLLGLGGNDTLWGKGGDDTLDGGAGNDRLLGGIGNDTYLFNLGGDWDTIFDYGGARDTIRFGAGISAGNINFARSGNDLVLGINGTNDQMIIQGWGYESSIERVEFDDGIVWEASDIQDRIAAVPIVGTEGDDSLSAWVGGTTLIGLEGNDSLYGEDGNDTFDGGPGNDILKGGVGNDIYLFNRGGGQDTIYDYDQYQVNLDTLRFGEGIAVDDITFARNGYGLILGIKGTTDQVRIGAWGYGDTYHDRIEQVEFANGTVWDTAYIDSQIADLANIGTENGDYLEAWAERNDSLQGLGGNDDLRGHNGNDILDGGTGDDYLLGGGGNDIYLFNPGGGQDTILEYESRTVDLDTIRFGNGIVAEDIIFTRSGKDLVLGINGTSDQLTIKNFVFGDIIDRMEFADGTVWDAGYIHSRISDVPVVGTVGNDSLQAWVDDNAILRGGEGNDRLFGDFQDSGGESATNLTYSDTASDLMDGGAGDDYIRSSIANDLLIGGTGADQILINGNDVMLFNRGDGQDWYYSYSGLSSEPVGEHAISLGGGVAYTDLRFSCGEDSSLVLEIGDTDSMIFHSWLNASWSDNKTIKTLQIIAEAMPDYNPESANQLLNKRIQQFDFLALANQFEAAIAADPAITTWELAPYLAEAYLGGSDTEALGGEMAYQYGMTGSVDQLSVEEMHLQLRDAQFGVAAQSINGAGANNAPVLAVPFSDMSVSQGEVLNFQVGHDAFTDPDSDDTLTLSATLANGDPLPDWLFFDAATGSFSGTPTSTSAGLWNVRVTATDNDGARASDEFVLDVADVITGTAGADTLTGTAENDTLQGGAGNDLLVGGDGNDTYLFNSGDGVDQIVDSSGTDTILFGEGITPDSLSLGLGSLLVRVGDQSDAIHIEDFNPEDPFNSSVIEQFQFSDGTVLTVDDLLARGFDIQGSSGNDLLTGTAITDRITGGDGNDTLVGGKGDDTLAGGGGTDTYVFNLGDGVDSIEDIFSATEGNRIVFGAGIAASDLAFAQDGADLIIQVGSQGDTLRLKDFDRFGNNGSLVADTLQFADGSLASLFDLTNTVPMLGVMPENQTALEDVAYSFTIPAETFTDPDAGDLLTYSATLGNGNPLPSWLVFDPVTRTFSGTPENGDVGMLDVTVMATDTAGASAIASFVLNIANVNDAPVVAAQIPAQSATEDAAFRFTIPADVFTDIDAGDALTYSATLADASALPAWLIFDSVTRTFSGTPENGDVGILNITVTATDRTGASVADTFAMEVINTNDAPTAMADAGFVAEDQSLLYSGNVLSNDTDVDAGTILCVTAPGEYVGRYGTLTIGADGGYIYSLDNASGEVQALAEGSTVVDQFIYNVSDGIVTVSGNLDITVAGANDAPVLAGDSAFLLEDLMVSASGNVLANDTDVDSGSTLAVFDPATQQGNYGTLSLTADGGYLYTLDNENSAVQSLGRETVVTEHFSYTATDGIANVDSALDITLLGSNDAPILTAPLADQQVKFNKNFSWQLPTGSFVDPDQGDTLDYTATLADGSALPAWLSFDAATQTFSGRAPRQVGTVEVKVTATDKVAATDSIVGSLAASDVFQITISHENHRQEHCNDGPGHSIPNRRRERDNHRMDAARDDDHFKASDKVRKGGNDHDAWRQPQREQAAYLNASHWGETQAPETEKSAKHEDPTVVFGRWLTMDLEVSKSLAEKKTLSWLDERMGADTTALGKSSSGFLGSTTTFGADLFSLQAGHGQELKGFKGLGEGLRKVA